MEVHHMTFRPLYDRVLVRPVEAETRTTGGIVIPDSATEKPGQGEVLAVGPGALLGNGEIRPIPVRVGDRVLFGKYSGSEVKLNGEKLLVIRESDILAVIDAQAKVEKAA
jgi:chaperonin GroES